MDTEIRLERIEARLAIDNLIARYAMAIDDRDLETVGECFCVDGVFGRWNGTDRAEGRGAIIDFYRARLGGTGPSFHVPHFAEIHVHDATTASGAVIAHGEMSVDGRLLIAGFRYQDRYRRDKDGAWRFLERLTRFHYFIPHDELDEAYGAVNRITFPGPPMSADLPDALETWKEFNG